MDPDYSLDSFTAQWLSAAEMPLANKFYRTHKFRGKARGSEPCMVVRDTTRQQIVACGILRKLTDCQLLAGVAVAPDYQGRGVARLLLSHMAEVFGANTFTFPYRPLMPFYASVGFVELEPDLLPPAILEPFSNYREQGRDIAAMHFQGLR